MIIFIDTKLEKLSLSAVVLNSRDRYIRKTMASPIFTPPTTTLKQTFAAEMHSYCSNNTITLLNTAKSIKI